MGYRCLVERVKALWLVATSYDSCPIRVASLEDERPRAWRDRGGRGYSNTRVWSSQGGLLAGRLAGYRLVGWTIGDVAGTLVVFGRSASVIGMDKEGTRALVLAKQVVGWRLAGWLVACCCGGVCRPSRGLKRR